jgi:hypothetical protein
MSNFCFDNAHWVGLLPPLLPIEQMKATLTLDFSDKLTADEQRELLAETMARQVPIETVLIEALRLRRDAGRLPPTNGRETAVMAA